MSSTTIYVIENNGDINELDSVPNASRFYYLMMEHFFDKYPMIFEVSSYVDVISIKRSEAYWKKAGSGFYEDYEDIVMVTSFDGIVIKKENLPKVINAYKIFNASKLGSFGEMSKIFEKALNLDILGVCINATSVCEFWTFDENSRFNLYDKSYKGKYKFLFDLINDKKESNNE